MTETVVANDMFHVELSDVASYEQNPRDITPEDVEKMAGVIRRYGFRVPILVREVDGAFELADGHLRVAAATQLGMTQVPAIDVSDMPDDMVKTFRIAVNKAATFADWDIAKLRDEVDGIEFGDDMLAVLGFDDTGLADLLAQDEPKPTKAAGKKAQSVSKTADRREASGDDDVVSLKIDMRLADRADVLSWLDTEMAARDLPTRSAALVAIAKGSAPRRRTRVRK